MCESDTHRHTCLYLHAHVGPRESCSRGHTGTRRQRSRTFRGTRPAPQLSSLAPAFWAPPAPPPSRPAPSTAGSPVLCSHSICAGFRLPGGGLDSQAPQGWQLGCCPHPAASFPSAAVLALPGPLPPRWAPGVVPPAAATASSAAAPEPCRAHLRLGGGGVDGEGGESRGKGLEMRRGQAEG